MDARNPNPPNVLTPIEATAMTQLRASWPTEVEPTTPAPSECLPTGGPSLGLEPLRLTLADEIAPAVHLDLGG